MIDTYITFPLSTSNFMMKTISFWRIMKDYLMFVVTIVLCNHASITASQKLNRWFPSGKCGENNLEVICTSTSATFYYMQLLRNTTLFEPVVSIFKDQAPQIQWPNESTLQTRATVSGSINNTSEAFLRYRIDKDRVQCPEDYTAYKCRFEGFIKIKRDAVTEETNPITWNTGRPSATSQYMVVITATIMFLKGSF
ncbi:uncharacterized protein LOC144621385 isoform X3 [Crassostrea virginica]